MAHKLSIFRGLVTFKSNTQKIWGVLIFLSIVTAVIEVAFGIIKPAFLTDSRAWDERTKLDFYYPYNCKGILYCVGLYAPSR